MEGDPVNLWNPPPRPTPYFSPSLIPLAFLLVQIPSCLVIVLYLIEMGCHKPDILQFLKNLTMKNKFKFNFKTMLGLIFLKQVCAGGGVQVKLGGVCCKKNMLQRWKAGNHYVIGKQIGKVRSSKIRWSSRNICWASWFGSLGLGEYEVGKKDLLSFHLNYLFIHSFLRRIVLRIKCTEGENTGGKSLCDLGLGKDF